MSIVYERWGVAVHHGDCLDVLRTLPDSSVHAVVTDPPYALDFMGKEWDRFTPAEFQAWCESWASECLRVLKPGGHLVAFGGTRTWHRLTAGIEDAGFEIRDSIAWLYGAGFPKSLDVSKAIDKAAGAQRTEVVGSKLGRPGMAKDGRNQSFDSSDVYGSGGVLSSDILAPATDEAKQWQGWGTALKPAFEPIVVARKPLAGTVASNVLAHGTGGLNIDGCRVGTDGGGTRCANRDDAGKCQGHQNAGRSTSGETFHGPDTVGGRWPTNVVLDDSQAEALDEQSGTSSSKRAVLTSKPGGVYGGGKGLPAHTGEYGFDDAGGASRFFPVFHWEAKASTAERPQVAGVAHPTVKPIALMRWLVRLVTPPGGIVLDPFLGSGTTAHACRAEGFQCVGIERDEQYIELIKARLDARPREDSPAVGKGKATPMDLLDLLDGVE